MSVAVRDDMIHTDDVVTPRASLQALAGVYVEIQDLIREIGLRCSMGTLSIQAYASLKQRADPFLLNPDPKIKTLQKQLQDVLDAAFVCTKKKLVRPALPPKSAEKKVVKPKSPVEEKSTSDRKDDSSEKPAPTVEVAKSGCCC
jgi:hypothetical protein